MDDYFKKLYCYYSNINRTSLYEWVSVGDI